MPKTKRSLYMADWHDIDKQMLQEGKARNADIMVALVANIRINPAITTNEIAEYTNLPKEDLDFCLEEFLDCGMVVQKYE